MPAGIEENDAGSGEPPRKRRRLSADAEIVGTCMYPLPSLLLLPLEKLNLTNLTVAKRRRHLEEVGLSENRQPISNEEFINGWLSDSGWSRQRRTSNAMLQLPSPGETATASSRKSAASVHATDYRETLEQYHVHIMDEEPPPDLIEHAENIISRQRETPEPDDAAIKKLRKTMRELRNKGEEEVKNKLGAVIIPGFNIPPNEKVEGVPRQLWTKAVPIPLDQNTLAKPLPLPRPGPDIAFGYSKTAFNSSQLPTIKLLEQGPLGPSFATPYNDLRFPFLVVEIKSQATDGSIRVATNQAAGAGAISMNGILELISRSSGLEDFDLNNPLFFSVTMDQNVACVNVHWIGRKSGTNEHTLHLEELRMLPLRYNDSIQVLQRAIKNIYDYASDSRLQLILSALDEYRKRLSHRGMQSQWRRLKQKWNPMHRHHHHNQLHQAKRSREPRRLTRTDVRRKKNQINGAHGLPSRMDKSRRKSNNLG